MRILFDHNTPVPLRHSLPAYEVVTAAERGWETLTNGELLDAAEASGVDIQLTADKGLQQEQNLTHRHIAVVILSRGNWPDVKVSIPRILDALNTCKPGTCTLVGCHTGIGTSTEASAP